MYVWVLKIGENFMAMKAEDEIFMDAYIVYVVYASVLCIMYVLYVYTYVHMYVWSYINVHMYVWVLKIGENLMALK
jgi:hypothetical protein